MRQLLFAAASALTAFAAAPAADPKPWSAAEDAKLLQGKWRLKHAIHGSVSGAPEPPAFVKVLDAEKEVIRFENGALTVESDSLTAAFRNDLDLTEEQKNGLGGSGVHRLVKLTPKGGAAFYASYTLSDDGLCVRYPAGCCSRSGLVLTFERAE